MDSKESIDNVFAYEDIVLFVYEELLILTMQWVIR